MKGKFIKKLTAYALTAAMIVSTPMTAFASEFADNFWYSDGANDDTLDIGGDLGTGTVTSTNTNTEALTKYAANITGIEITAASTGKASAVLDLNVNPKDVLTAKVLFDSAVTPSEEEVKAINAHIEWSTSNYSIVRPRVSSENRAECNITGYKGGFATITAGLNVSGASSLENAYDHVAKCRVMVKKPATAVQWNLKDGDELYAGHTYDLQDYVTLVPADAYEKVSFTVEGSCGKAGTFDTENGVLSLAKKIKPADEATIKITANIEANKPVTVEVKLTQGNPVKSLKINEKKPTYDIGEMKYDQSDKDNIVKMTPGKILEKNQSKKLTVTATGTSGGETTDDLVWTSSDSRIVRVRTIEGKNAETVKTDTRNNNSNRYESMAAGPLKEVIFEGMSVGKADVMVQSTSGKKAKISVTVTAKLIKIDSVSIDKNTTYTGKTTPLVIKRIPAENNDKLKVVAAAAKGKLPKGLKVKAAITPTITPDKSLAKVAGTAAGNDKVIDANTIKVEQAKANPGTKTKIASEPMAAFTVKQSDVEISNIAGMGKATLDKAKIKMNSNRIINFSAVKASDAHWNPGEDAVSWVTSKETVATVENGKVKVIGDGSVKITASSVWLDGNKPKETKKVVTINSTPKCEGFVLKADTVTVQKGKAAKITISQQVPKKAADDVVWYKVTTDKDGMETYTQLQEGEFKKNKNCVINTSASEYEPGDVVKIVVMTKNDESVMAEARLVITAGK